MRYKPNNHRKKQRVKDEFVNKTTYNTKQRQYLKLVEAKRAESVKIECSLCFRKVSINLEEYHDKIACPSCMNKGKISFYQLT